MRRQSGAGALAALALTCVFGATLLLSLAAGAVVYRRVSDRVEESSGVRVSLSYITAKLHAADAAAKAADIRLLEVRLGRGLGGKSFVLLTGEVAAVTAAVEAAEALEETQGLMGKSVVIPAPHPDLLRSMQ